MRFRRLLIAVLFLASLGTPGETAASGRHAPFWACSDGKGTISLFWLPPDGRWPAGGFRLERISRGKAVVVAAKLAPAEDAEAMALLDPADSATIRLLADRIRTGSLTDDERNHSITVTGRTAVVDLDFGRALGVRHRDRTRGPGKIKYRLKALSADGRTESTLESNDVDPGKPTPAPGQPQTLKAEIRQDGVALFWKDPSAGGLTPVVAYHISRTGPDRKVQPLTQIPLVLNRHLNKGAADFLDAEAPRETLTYRVQGVDVFGRRSAYAQTRILGTDFPAPLPATNRTAAVATTSAETPAGPGGVASRKETNLRPPQEGTSGAPEPAAPVPATPPAAQAAAAAETGVPPEPVAEPAAAAPAAAHATEPETIFWRPLARMETIIHPPPAEIPGRPARVEPAPAAPAETGARPEPAAALEPGHYSGKSAASMETITPPSQEGNAGAPEPAAPGAEAAGSPVPPEPAAAPATAHAAEPDTIFWRPLARMEPIIHPPSTGNPEGSARVEPAPAAPAVTGVPPESAANRAPSNGNGPPTPVIVGIQGTTGTVIIEFRSGGTGKESSRVLVIRSDYPMSPGHVVGQSSPQARTWEDTSVSPGQNLWYRLVAVDKDGNRSLPTNPRWIRVSPR